MPNLKIDVEALKKTIRSEAERAIERLEMMAKGCIDEVQQAASASKAMPASASDLIASAEVCLVADVNTGQFPPRERRLQVTIDLEGGNSLQMASYDYERRPMIAEGRYRAIFVLIPIETR